MKRTVIALAALATAENMLYLAVQGLGANYIKLAVLAGSAQRQRAIVQRTGDLAMFPQVPNCEVSGRIQFAG
jgi:hypothetical protein